jgi:hypothetical protein
VGPAAATVLVPPASPASRGPGTLTRLLRDAHTAGNALPAIEVLTAASRLRPAFRGEADAGARLDATVIIPSVRPPHLVCLPSFLPGSGPAQFLRLAAGCDRRRSISALTLPGFRPGDRLPGSWRAATGLMAGAALRVAAGDPLVLVGYSVGGALAHAVAEILERDGMIVNGVVLIDTYEPHGDGAARAFAAAMGSILDRDHASVVLDDDGLLAMGAYIRLLDEWVPTEISAPTLLIRAAEPLGDGVPWELAETTAQAGRDHFSIIEADAADTADTIEGWLSI